MVDWMEIVIVLGMNMFEMDIWCDGEVVVEVVDVFGKECYIMVWESKVWLSVISRESIGGWFKIGFLVGIFWFLKGIIGIVVVFVFDEEYSIFFM